MRILALCLIAVLALAACGGEDEGGDGAPFVSSGVSREAFDGVAESLTLMPGETFAGLLHDTEIAAVFDAATAFFNGRLRNEADEAVCDVRVAVVLDGDAGSAVEAVFDGLTAMGRATFELPVAGTAFTDWTVQVETSGCSSAPAAMASGEGSEGGGEHGAGGEGSGEGNGEHGAGGEGSGEGSVDGAERGEEASPARPITESIAGTRGDQAYAFSFHADTELFVGTVENISETNVVCGSRTEIHLGVGGSVTELGPTIPEDLAPGDILDVVLYLHPFPAGEAVTYQLHPEASACP